MIHRFAATIAGGEHDVSVEPQGEGRFRVTIDGRAVELDARRVEATTWSLLPVLGGRARLVDLDNVGNDTVATVGGASYVVKLGDPRRAAIARATQPKTSGPTAVRAPMPGKLVKLLVRAGDAVTAGQGVVVVEAMKMENELRSPRDGTVGEVLAREGQNVESGQVLVTIA